MPENEKRQKMHLQACAFRLISSFRYSWNARDVVEERKRILWVRRKLRATWKFTIQWFCHRRTHWSWLYQLINGHPFFVCVCVGSLGIKSGNVSVRFIEWNKKSRNSPSRLGCCCIAVDRFVNRFVDLKLRPFNLHEEKRKERFIALN